MKEIGKIQEKALTKSKLYLNKFGKTKFDKRKNNIFYLSSYVNCIGLIKIKNFLKLNVNPIKKIYIILKDIFYSAYYVNNYCHKFESKYNFNQIIVSWANKKNFNKKGVFYDKLFNINSNYKKKKILWYLLYNDKDLPEKIDKNIILFQPIKFKSFNIINLIKVISANFNKISLGLDYFLNSISSHAYLGEIVFNNFTKFYKNNIKIIKIPYEGQPFQNEIIRVVKSRNLKTKVIGYMHGAPLPLPTNLIKKSYSPDKIIVNGADQRKCFEKFLGWKKKDIIIKPSSRFKSKNIIKKNLIYLPANIKKPRIILESLANLIENKLINLHHVKIKEHPAALGFSYAKPLIEKIMKLRKKQENLNNYKYKDVLIFVGLSGGVIEALEKNLNVIHIVEDNQIDLYNKEIWPNVINKQLFKNVYVYKLKKRGQMIKFGNNTTNYFN